MDGALERTPGSVMVATGRGGNVCAIVVILVLVQSSMCYVLPQRGRRASCVRLGHANIQAEKVRVSVHRSCRDDAPKCSNGGNLANLISTFLAANYGPHADHLKLAGVVSLATQRIRPRGCSRPFNELFLALLDRLQPHQEMFVNANVEKWPVAAFALQQIEEEHKQDAFAGSMSTDEADAKQGNVDTAVASWFSEERANAWAGRLCSNFERWAWLRRLVDDFDAVSWEEVNCILSVKIGYKPFSKATELTVAEFLAGQGGLRSNQSRAANDELSAKNSSTRHAQAATSCSDAGTDFSERLSALSRLLHPSLRPQFRRHSPLVPLSAESGDVLVELIELDIPRRSESTFLHNSWIPLLHGAEATKLKDSIEDSQAQAEFSPQRQMSDWRKRSSIAKWLHAMDFLESGLTPFRDIPQPRRRELADAYGWRDA
eukprot:GHVU01200923.1.p1 GENE.GHVU01200923.1~~GHVU01200923.1.p1  ORF type:complete len:431 (+),score=23.44 GHVU01200923.1:228-1520(+)